jgi:hypothetical protein
LAASGGDPESWWVTTQPVYHWDITGLALLPFKRPDGVVQEFQTFEGDDLKRLFRSAGARKALNLLPTKALTGHRASAT